MSNRNSNISSSDHASTINNLTTQFASLSVTSQGMVSTSQLPRPNRTSEMKRINNKILQLIKRWKLRPFLRGNYRNSNLLPVIEIAQETFHWPDHIFQQRKQIVINLYDRREQQIQEATILLENANLDQYNEWLIGFGRAPVPSLNQANKAFKNIFINIYDLKEKLYHKKFDNLYQLRNYTIRNKLYYPLGQAKCEAIKIVLKHIRGNVQ